MGKYTAWIIGIAAIILILIFRKGITKLLGIIPKDGTRCITNPTPPGAISIVGPIYGIYQDGVCVLPPPKEGSTCTLDDGSVGTIQDGVCTPPRPGPVTERTSAPESIIVSVNSKLPYPYSGCLYGNARKYHMGLLQIFKISCP